MIKILSLRNTTCYTSTKSTWEMLGNPRPCWTLNNGSKDFFQRLGIPFVTPILLINTFLFPTFLKTSRIFRTLNYYFYIFFHLWICFSRSFSKGFLFFISFFTSRLFHLYTLSKTPFTFLFAEEGSSSYRNVHVYKTYSQC